jgi:uncharacterized protein YdcH (DUF465 family)
MEGHHHKIGEEFPEYREQIHVLKMSNAHFAGLFDQWETIDKRIARAESRIELMSQEEEEVLRKQRLALKDELYSMLRNSKA